MSVTLKAARVNAGKSVEEACVKFEVSPSTLWRWESGKAYPDAEQIKQIEDFYRVKYEDIDFLCPPIT